MMFAGFGVTLRDLPTYLYWGSYVSYLRYGLEGFIGAIYGKERPNLECNEALYCHYKWVPAYKYLDFFLINLLKICGITTLLQITEIHFCYYLYLLFRYPRQFLEEIAMSPDMFWWDVLALTVTLFFFRIAAFILLKWKLNAVR